ncbi:hypothetical protein EON65_16990 [archaeon]|nr:MAG: hypothetical protein EON65_16990 [archaeon]
MMTSCEEEGMDEVSNITDETIEEIDRDPAVAAAGTALSQLNLEKTSHTTSNKASTEDVLLHRTPCVVNESSNTTDSQVVRSMLLICMQDYFLS